MKNKEYFAPDFSELIPGSLADLEENTESEIRDKKIRALQLAEDGRVVDAWSLIESAAKEASKTGDGGLIEEVRLVRSRISQLLSG